MRDQTCVHRSRVHLNIAADTFRGLGSSFKHWISCFSVNFSAFSASIYSANEVIYLKENTQFKHTEQTSEQLLKKQKSSSSLVLLFMGDECKSTPLWNVKLSLIPVTALDIVRRGQTFTSRTHILNIWSCFWPTFPEKQMRGRFQDGCQSDVDFWREAVLWGFPWTWKSNKSHISHSNTWRSMTTNRTGLCSPAQVVFLLFYTLSY